MVHQTMNTSNTKAARASSKIKPIAAISKWGAATILGALAACSTTVPPEPLPAPKRTPIVEAAPAPARATLLRDGARWVAADWDELPGWGDDRALELWPALLRGCNRPAPGWAPLCARASLDTPTSDHEARLWLMQHLRPWRVESLDGQAEGQLTGYYEPELQARRVAGGGFQVPLLAAPPDLALRRPYFTRQQIDSEPLRGKLPALVYIEDPIDLQILQLQGSGRVRLQDEGRWLRMAYAGHNDHPLQPLGRSLATMGEWKEGPAAPRSAVREWARRNPQRLNELMWRNPRYVFFREEALPDPDLGPRGAQGVPLTPGRSIAVDKTSLPYGTPVWLDTTQPLSTVPLRRLVMAQDTGGSIIGAVRADFFWGWGPEAETQAGRTRQVLRLWALWPRT